MISNRAIVKTLNVWAWIVLIIGVFAFIGLAIAQSGNFNFRVVLLLLGYLTLPVISSFMIFAIARTLRIVSRMEEKQEELKNEINSIKQY